MNLYNYGHAAISVVGLTVASCNQNEQVSTRVSERTKAILSSEQSSQSTENIKGSQEFMSLLRYTSDLVESKERMMDYTKKTGVDIQVDIFSKSIKLIEKEEDYTEKFVIFINNGFYNISYEKGDIKEVYRVWYEKAEPVLKRIHSRVEDLEDFIQG